MTGIEEWRPVVGWEHRYQISDFGRVRRISTGRILRGSNHTSGYRNVGLSPGVNMRTVHRLVAEAFLGPRPTGMQINHRNSVKTDNRLDNLEYVTPAENVRHHLESTGGVVLCKGCGGVGHRLKTCGRPRRNPSLHRVDGKNCCRSCGQPGHQQKTCGRAPETRVAPAAPIREPRIPRPRVPQRCRKCTAGGHNTRSCGRQPAKKIPRPPRPSKPRRYKAPGLRLLPEPVIAFVSTLPNDAAIQRMIDRHNAARAQAARP